MGEKAVTGFLLQGMIIDVLDVDGDAPVLAGATEDTGLYMCGTIRLMDAVRRSWTERGLSYPNLRFETFGNSGWYDPEEFVVKVPSLGLQVLVGPSRRLL